MPTRIAGQSNSVIGDRTSPFGGLGSNGAQHTPEAREDQPLATASGSYRFRAGLIHNLLAAQFIRGHGDVSGNEVANAIWQAMTAGRAGETQ